MCLEASTVKFKFQGHLELPVTHETGMLANSDVIFYTQGFSFTKVSVFNKLNYPVRHSFHPL